MKKLATIRVLCALAVSVLVIPAYADDKLQAMTPVTPQTQAKQGSSDVFVHLFEWSWPDIALECENFLGPKGYAAVQISPPQEHITGTQWWTRYQPVSYKIESRNGSRAEFADMVKRCNTVGVAIYADVLMNHMAGIFTGKGTAGSDYTQYQYTVPYNYDDFHHCGRNGDDRIANYQDLWEVQNCNLGTLVDINTGKPAVQQKIAAYLNDLLSLGVSGFRLDAAKHIAHQEISQILTLVDSSPFIFQEVIDRGGEPVNAMDYLVNGSVTETKYPFALAEAFKGGHLDSLLSIDSLPGFLPSNKAVVYIDNHDIQRGHAGGNNNLSHKNGAIYDLANVFMLAWPYGYPKVMSSYDFDNSDQGPPLSHPIINASCSTEWICEHRRPIISSMVGFRKITADMPVTNWRVIDDKVISFSRGNKGHVIINVGATAVDAAFVTSMAPGDYCNITAAKTAENCQGGMLQVDNQGTLKITVAPMSAVVIKN